jgi:hypothetical protein
MECRFDVVGMVGQMRKVVSKENENNVGGLLVGRLDNKSNSR